jgi:hypothetical protein
VDRLQPANVISTYYGASPKRSTSGGKFGTWMAVSSGITGDPLFYPPLALDETNPSNIALGTTVINLDDAQGSGGWLTNVTLPGITDKVSAIHYVTSNLIFAGTTTGQVYRLAKTGSTWTASAINASPLPGQWIWDVVARPDDHNTVIVAMSGFGSVASPLAHIWRGTVSASGTSAVWTNISGTGAATLPDIPVNALAIDPAAPNTYYIATDVAVYRTTDAGTTWAPFSDGLPNCAVFDLRLHHPTRVLRAGTHGRGLWERKLDALSMPDADLFVRDHLMATGRQTPTPGGVTAAFEDPLQYVSLGDQLWWWQCADIKVDALEGAVPSYQMPVASVDSVMFESQLQHRNAQRGRVNRVYVQVHNRGFAQASNVTVKVLFADASAGLPALPSDFWTTFPNNSAIPSGWTPIGPAKVVASISPTEAAVLEWDWSTPATAADHSCLLVVMDSPANAIPAGNKVFSVGALVPNEKRVGLKNLHIVDAAPGTYFATIIRFHSIPRRPLGIRIAPSAVEGWSIGMVLPKAAAGKVQDGWEVRKPAAAVLAALRGRLGAEVAQYDMTRHLVLSSPGKGGLLTGAAVPKDGLPAVLVFGAPPRTTRRAAATFTIVQEEDGRVVGGSTYVLRSVTKK